MVKCLLVDDESPAINLLENYIKRLDNFQIIASCYSAIEAFEVIKKEDIDLLFLDIEMPVLKGLDFLKTLKNPPKVIITTAYREYAIEGYDLDIVDYLLKPIPFKRFVKAIDRYYERVQLPFKNKLEKKADNSFFYVNVNKKQIKIIFDDILYIESLKDYVRIHSKNQRLVVKSNIGKIEEQLSKSLFLRVHRSYIISLDKITAFTQKDIEIGNIEIPIGSSYSTEILKIISNS
ncbi:DNA-binding response regulator [Tenacibaculum sp. Bg11-29]|uniref:LytR/AlgR family response regulator transcription factor n=1 Tax=Tenacibaculum sp. Bg11-29 TaxID=2058306 RepID=UPI000C31D049|nr:LytTR family DNA-binding domain-containing protein [Tenacibaculum sp. Bg11-29]PKH51291.1 DNA-binding response regulator [Tenacibaculum sp. Bg11-29]